MPSISFYTPCKTLENQRFSDVFRGYRKRPLAWNGLILDYWNATLVTFFETFYTTLSIKVNQNGKSYGTFPK